MFTIRDLNKQTRVARVTVAVSIVFLLVWSTAAGLLGSPSTKLTQVQSNSNSSFLPAGTESARVAQYISDIQMSLTGGSNVSVVNGFIVVKRLDGATLNQTERERMKADFQRYVFSAEMTNGKRVGEYIGSTSLTFNMSQDEKAMLVGFSVADVDNVEGEETYFAVAIVVEAMKESFKAFTDYEMYISGDAGLLADYADAFTTIDSMLFYIAAGVVAFILILVYRSPMLWIVPLVSVGIALIIAQGIVYYITKAGWIELSGQNQSVLLILIFGASTDYALLLINGYREELHFDESRFTSMRTAVRHVIAPISASSSTLIVALLMLLLSKTKVIQGLGPVCTVGIGVSYLVALTFLPGLLVLFGRWIFWPNIPKVDYRRDEVRKVWRWIANVATRSARVTWIVITGILIGSTLFVISLDTSGVRTEDAFIKTTDSAEGQRLVVEHFLPGENNPLYVVAEEHDVAKATQLLERNVDIRSVRRMTQQDFLGNRGTSDSIVFDKRVVFIVETKYGAEDPQALGVVREVRNDLSDMSNIMVGGASAVQLDLNDASLLDSVLIMPLVFVAILLILMILLRSFLAPILLILTISVSYLATLGVSTAVFTHIFGFKATDAVFPLFVFIFLVGLGVDYNIFLVTRMREEVRRLGTLEGIKKGLSATGGVITSAGVVLAATFATLGVMPLTTLIQIGFAVSFGILLDVLLVRTFLVPALMFDIGKKVWWPRKFIADSRFMRNRDIRGCGCKACKQRHRISGI